MMDFFHLIPRVDMPLDDFWSLMVNTTNWVITPEKRIYDWIQEDLDKTSHVLDFRRTNGNGLLRRTLGETICLNLDIPRFSWRFTNMVAIIKNTGSNTTNAGYNDAPPSSAFIDVLPNISLKTLQDTSTVTTSIREGVSLFRNKETEILTASSKKEKRLVARCQLSRRTKKRLNCITDVDLRESIKNWIEENFRTETVQKLAISLAAAGIEDEGLGWLESDDEESDSDDDAEY
jgi:hypothetical protein